MLRTSKRLIAGAMIAGLGLTATACSSTGGKRAADKAQRAVSAGKATTARITIAMITHGQPGDTFFDIVRKGASAAAAKDNVKVEYSADPQSANQVNLVQSAIDSKVDGIATTMSDPVALTPVIKKAVAAGIPVVAFNQGFDSFKAAGAVAYFGSDEQTAGIEAGKRAAASGAKHLLCIPQAQGSTALETRCKGVQQGFTASGGRYDKIYVNGADLPSVASTISAKLKQDPSIDYVVTLGAPIALTAIQAIKDAGSKAKLATFDFNPQVPPAVNNGSLQFVIDQQPYLQGYLAIDQLWLYKANANIMGGGKPVPTGPYFIDKSNIAAIAKFAAGGTR